MAIDIIFIVWLVVLLVKGLQKSDNWLGWFMFSRARYFQMSLRDRRGSVDIWDYVPHCQVMLSQRQIEALLKHIQAERRAGYLEGSVTMYLTEGRKEFMIRRSRLVPVAMAGDE